MRRRGREQARGGTNPRAPRLCEIFNNIVNGLAICELKRREAIGPRISKDTPCNRDFTDLKQQRMEMHSARLMLFTYENVTQMSAAILTNSLKKTVGHVYTA